MSKSLYVPSYADGLIRVIPNVALALAGMLIYLDDNTEKLSLALAVVFLVIAIYTLASAILKKPRVYVENGNIVTDRLLGKQAVQTTSIKSHKLVKRSLIITSNHYVECRLSKEIELRELFGVLKVNSRSITLSVGAKEIDKFLK